MSNPDDRSRIDELIARADRVAQQPLPLPRSRALPVVMLGLAGVAAIWIGVSMAASEDDGPSQISGPTTAVPLAVTTLPTSTTVPTVITLPPATLPTTLPNTTPNTTSTTQGGSTTAPFVEDPAQPVRWMVATGGKWHLQGGVPDQATADRLHDIVAAAVGADNVLVEYVILAGTPLPQTEPVFVHDAIQFPPNSAALDATAQAVLDGVALMMAQNPQVTLDVRGYTDSTGPDDSNLELSQARVDMIVTYLAFRGIDPARLTGTGYGEANPVADNNTEEGRALNRRVEFTIHHLLA